MLAVGTLFGFWVVMLSVEPTEAGEQPYYLASRSWSDYQLYQTQVTWTEAHDNCKTIGGHLVEINTVEENDLIVDALNALDQPGDPHIGARRLTAHPNHYFWDSMGWMVRYNNWNDDVFEHDAVQMVSSDGYKWSDVPEDATGSYICEFPKYLVRTDDTDYQLYDGNVRWNTARDTCKGLRGHLLEIDSIEENDRIVNALNRLDGTVSPFTNGRYEAGVFVWDRTNQGLTFTNWYPDEPDVRGRYVVMSASWGHKWDGVSASAEHPFICEIPHYLARGSDVDYKLFEFRVVWSEARDNCQALGGHLLEIDSAEENALIVDTIVYFRQHIHPYIGGRKLSDGSWVWDSNGQSITFVNWADNQPSGNGPSIVMKSGTTRQWDDVRDTTLAPYVCELPRAVA